MGLNMEVFYCRATSTLTYLVFDEESKDAVLMDPIWDYTPETATLSHESMDKLLSFIEEKKLKLHYILETHAHADHITAALEIKKKLPEIKIAIGKNITKVQDLFGELFNFKNIVEEKNFDILLNEEDILVAGTIKIKTIFTPGHTPACSSYLVDDMLFTGDALLMPDIGTGRCDFPGGSAIDLYHSIHEKLYTLSDETRVFVGHDYPPEGRDLAYQTTISESKNSNVQLKESTERDEFISFRTKRDSTLSPPKLLLPSIQVNIRGGQLPALEDNGQSYLKFPLQIK